MDVFDLRNALIADYSTYVSSFIKIKDERIYQYVKSSLADGLLWPEPLIQLNPAFMAGRSIDDLTAEGVLHPECGRIFRRKESPTDTGKLFHLHKHQEEAALLGATGENYILTTGTGSGKSLSYIIPIVDRVLKNGTGKGIQAIIVYPMNALANSQEGELKKFLQFGYPDLKGPVTFARYTGQEDIQERERIRTTPPISF